MGNGTHIRARAKRRLTAMTAMAVVIASAGLAFEPHAVHAAQAKEGPGVEESPAANTPTQANSGTPSAATYHPLTPARILDTRDGLGIATHLDEGASADLAVTGHGGVPADGVAAVVLNLTATNATGPTYVTAWPAGTDRPLASNLNVVAGQDVPNLVVVPVGTTGAAAGKVSLYNNHGSVDLLADVEGWFAVGSEYMPLSPTRIMDTRIGLGVSTAIAAHTTVDLQVAGHGGVPATGVGAVVINLTATNPTAATYVTAWPRGVAQPVASNLNVVADQTSPNLVIVPVGTDGTVSFYNNAGTLDLVADIQGWFPTGSKYNPLAPTRILDTRDGLGIAAALGGPKSADLQVTGHGGVPATGASAVVLNVTATNPTASTYVTVWPTGVAQPNASNLNVVAGQTAPNLVIVPVGMDGKISLYSNNGTTDLVADVQGWFPLATQAGGPVDTPGAPAAQWAVRPASVLLAPGEARTVDLVPVDENGVERPGDFDTQSVSIKGSGDGSTAEYVGDDKILVTAGPSPSTVLFGVTVDGATTAIPLNASVVNLQPGVTQLPDESLVFPVPYVGTDDAQAAALGDLKDATGIAGFTLDEIRARLKVNLDGDPNAVDVPDARYPLILRGTSPATGSLIVTGGGSLVNGRVVEPDGLPSLQRNGFSLITVAMVPLHDLYFDLSYNVSGDDLTKVNVPVDVADGLLPSDDDIDRAAQEAIARQPGKESVKYDLPGGITCEVALGVPDIKLLPPTPALVPDLEAWADIDHGLEGDFKFLFSITGKVNGGASFEITSKLGATCEIPFTEPKDLIVDIPAGPLTGLLNGELGYQFLGEVGLTWKLGPKMVGSVNCEIGVTLKFGFERRNGTWNNLSGVDPIKGCPTYGGHLPTLNGVPMSLELSGALNLKLDVGGILGGRVTRVFRWLVHDPKLGDFTLLTGKMGPKLTFNVENQDNVLTDEASSTKLSLTMTGSIALELKNLSWLYTIFSVSDGPGASATLWELNPEPEFPGFPGFQAPASTGMSYSIDGGPMQSVDTNVFVEPGDIVEVESALDSAANPVTVRAVYTQPAVGDFEESDWWNEVAASSGTIRIRHTVTQADCDSMSDGQAGFTPTEFKILGETETVGGWDIGFPVPVWGGKFKVQCVLGKMNFNPATVEDFHDRAEVNLESYGKSTVDWHVTKKPDFVSLVTPDHGTWPVNTNEGAKTVESIVIREIVRPPGECYDGAEGDVKVASDGNKRGDATLHVVLPDPCYIKFDKESITGSGTAHLLTKGFGADTFAVKPSSVPDWLTVLPMTGDLVTAPITEQSITFGFTVDHRDATCEVQLPNRATVIVESPTRGKASILIIQPKVDRDPNCAPVAGAGQGDPHMHSFDGGYYEGQVRGEFVYARSTPDADADVEVRVRQQPSRIGAVLYPVTSITATAVRVGEHKVEVYARDEGPGGVETAAIPPKVYVDGVMTDLPDGQPIEVAEGFSIVRNGNLVELNAPYVHVTTRTYSAIMDTTVSADLGAPIAGLLGSPNGVLADDFTPAGGGAPYTLQEIQGDVVKLRAFTGSWKIDPADTIFTQDYVGNNDPDPTVDPAEMAMLLQQAEDLLDGLNTVCDVQGAIDNHLLDGLALELGIGRTSKELAAYSCQYIVRGTATSGDSPIPGLDVSVTVPGLTPCNTTTGSDGRYQCVLTPDYDPASGDPKPAAPPWNIDVKARFAGSPAVIASNSSVVIDHAAEVSGQPVGAFVDLSIDPSLLPNVNVSGTMLQAGQPYPDPVSVNIKGYDASDHLLVELLQTVTPNPVDGSYAFTKVLPIGATHATIVAMVGLQCCPGTEYPTVTPSGLHNGPNGVPFSFDDDPPIVGFTGTMTGIGGAPLTGPITVFYQTFNGATVVNSDYILVNPAGNDGSYTIPPIRLPRTATSVKVTAQVGLTPTDFPTQTFAIAPGASTKTFNASYVPPTLSISGNLTKASVGLTDPVDVRITSFSASNVQLGNIQVIHITSIDPTTGAYAVAPFAIPVGTKRVSAHAQLGVLQTPFTTRELTNIPATGNSALDMSFDFNPPIITVTGIAKKNGSPYTQQFGVQLLSFYGVDLFTQLKTAAPDADGLYSVTFEAPVGTLKIRAVAQIGPAVNEYPTTGDITGVEPGAQNLPFDINYNTPEVVIAGNLTDAAGNAMPAGQRVELTAYDDSTGTHQIFTTSVNVDPAAGTGHYEVSITVPTTTLSVQPAVLLGPLNDKVSGPLAQVVIGNANQITLNAVYNPPILKLHGTMTQPGGTPYTGAIFIRVQSKDSVGGLLADQFWTAHLDANGFYNDIDVTLLSATTTVVITPQAGPSQNWMPVTKTVVPGDNDFLLDVVQNLPRLHLTGTAKRNGVNINTSFGVKIEALNGSGTVLQTLNTGVTAANGAYSLTWDAPLTTASARITADVSPFAFDDVVQTFTGIQNGVNELTLDFNDSSKRLQMSGTVTSDGVPYHGIVTFYVNYGHGSPRVQDALQPYGVPTDATGHYALDQIIPDASTQAFIDAMVPTGFGSSTAPVSTEITGLTLPVNTVVFDAAYVPLHVLLSGTITVDGTPPGGTVPVLFSILTDNNQTFTKTVQVDPDDATGHYDVSVAEPFNAVTATATIEVGPDYDWFVSDPISLSGTADTPATLDAIYDPVYLSFTGRIRDAGVAADDIRFTVRGVTGNNVSGPIGPDIVVTPDGTGAFSTVTMAVPYPRTADSLQIAVDYHLAGEGVLQRHEFGTGIDIADPPHDETLTVDRDTQVVDVAGVTVDGNGVPKNYENLVVSTAEYDAVHNYLGGSGFILGYADLNGSFTMHLEPNQNAATIDISIGGGAPTTVDVTHNVDAFHTTADIGNYAITTGATLRISGGFTVGEDPDTEVPIGPDSLRIVVTPYTFDKDDWQADPPYVHNGPPIEIAPENVTVGDDPDHDEEFFTSTHLPANTNLIDVQYFVDDDPVPYRSGYILDPDDQNPLVQYFDYGGPQVQTVEVHTTFGHYDAGPPANCGIYGDSPFIVHLSAETYAVADPSHTRSVFNGLIVPDPDDADDGAVVTIRVPVEPGHDKIDFSDDTTGIYTDAHMTWSGSTGQLLDPDNTISTFVGRGCNPFDPQP